MSNSLKHNFVSELDQFLQDFDQTHPEKSSTQRCEIEKHARVRQLRDKPEANNAQSKKEQTIWEKF